MDITHEELKRMFESDKQFLNRIKELIEKGEEPNEQDTRRFFLLLIQDMLEKRGGK